ncbi:MAG: hypothetical protein WAN69_07470 [Candidatus Korobacteraceae bacterium]
MSKSIICSRVISLCAVFILAAAISAHAQSSTPTDSRLKLQAQLVLTPEFCATKYGENHSAFKVEDAWEVGSAACTELEPALKGTFSSLTVVTTPASSSDADVVLTPKFVNTSATKTMWANSKRELLVVLEWTAKDKSGKTVWVETIQGTATEKEGNGFSHTKHAKTLSAKSVNDAAAKSAAAMSASAELRKLASVNSGSTTGKN